ncbi:MAG: SET domain-containing protein-lysine N-methyltransferase [Verrucomicrobia bacterium]|nr:SET domain-containing protein-lysine N-methyltransferase [Verrucomicrobiota bacterium]
MEQAFILPLPKYTGPHPSDLSDQEEIDQNEQIALWRNVLDKLRDRKITWEQFFSYLPEGIETICSHPASRIAIDRNGQTLLHIAISQERNDVVELLSGDYQLRLRRNNFGMTPLEHAQFLQRPFCLKSLGSPLPKEFCSQPNVEIESKAEQLSHLTYLPYPIFEQEKILNEILDRCGKAKVDDAIPPEKIWMGIYFDKEIQTGLNPRVSIRWIDDEVGFGVYALQRIPSCAFVGEYTGVIKERKKRLLKDKTYCVRYTTWQTGRRKFVVDAETQGNFTRFINHSNKPNLGLQSVYWRGLPRMVFISLKEIPEGAQLTFDYGTFFWKEIRQVPKKLA